MIVRDEEGNLPDCVRAASPLVDEWIVYDTGSTDRTRELASELGCTVIAGEWRDDFSWARNESLKHATGDWVVVLDADDRLERPERLRTLVASDPPVDVLELMVVCSAEDDTTQRIWQPRVFRGTPRYSGTVHEWPEITGQRVARCQAAVVHHVGYEDADLHRRKAERNLRLLTTLPEDDPARWYHQVRTHAALRDWPAVRDAVARLEELDVHVGVDLRLYQANALLADGQHRDAAALLLGAINQQPAHPDAWLALLNAATLGWLHACRDLRAHPERVEGPVASLDRVRRVAESLVAAGLFKPELLTSSLAGADGAEPTTGCFPEPKENEPWRTSAVTGSRPPSST